MVTYAGMEWKAALRQYFQVVRNFDAVKAPFDAQLELLRAFGELEEEWRAPLALAVAALETARDRQHARAALAIAEMLADMLCESTQKHLAATDDPSRYHESLEQELRDRLRRREQRSRRSVEAAACTKPVTFCTHLAAIRSLLPSCPCWQAAWRETSS